jgi:septal ring factor EnvC (AmiA/AmiB activator)
MLKLPTSITLFLLMMFSLAAIGNADSGKELDQVRSKIQRIQKTLQTSGGERTRAQKKLEEAERAEQEVQKELLQLRKERRATRQRLNELEHQVNQQKRSLGQQQDNLARQMRDAYMAGDDQVLKIALSQGNPGELGRMLTWYSYFGRERDRMISELQQQLAELGKAAAQIAAEATRLEAMEEEQADYLQELADAREERSRILAAIKSDISEQNASIKQLQKQEKELESVLSSLATNLASLPLLEGKPFSKQKGRLQWPVQGKQLAKFGQSRADGLMRYNGVMIQADAGTNVHAIYSGRVVFADWLPALGLLLIIEHTDGYMSLYGHNQDLVKEAGQSVKAGETVAHVGNTGGQTRPALYFELRENAKPIDPAKWLP